MASKSSSSSLNDNSKPSGRVFTSYLGRRFGAIPGIPVGTTFASRSEMVRSGLHPASYAGIYGSKWDGARSIVMNGTYDDEDKGERFVYIGTGGNDRFGQRPQTHDQTLEHPSNAALITSSCTGKPVRVIRGYNTQSRYRTTEGFRYDGLYTVTACETAKTKKGLLVCKFNFERLPNQQPLSGEGSASVPVSPSSTPISDENSKGCTSPPERSLSPDIPIVVDRSPPLVSTSRSGVSHSPTQSPFVRTSQPYEEPLTAERPSRSQPIVLVPRRRKRAVPRLHFTRSRPASSGSAIPRQTIGNEPSLVTAINHAFSSRPGRSQSPQIEQVAPTERALSPLAEAAAPSVPQSSLPDESSEPPLLDAMPDTSTIPTGPIAAISSIPADVDSGEELRVITASLAGLHEPWTTEETVRLIELALRIDTILAQRGTAASHQRCALREGIVQCMLDETNNQVIYSVLRVCLQGVCEHLQSTS